VSLGCENDLEASGAGTGAGPRRGLGGRGFQGGVVGSRAIRTR
jgi:hypothetical protein